MYQPKHHIQQWDLQFCKTGKQIFLSHQHLEAQLNKSSYETNSLSWALSVCSLYITQYNFSPSKLQITLRSSGANATKKKKDSLSTEVPGINSADF